MDVKVELPDAVFREVILPASKSVTARALIVNALTDNPAPLLNVAQCDDSNAMIGALKSDSEVVNVGAAGTAMRFLTAFFATQEHRSVTLDGTERMRRRPIAPLVDALRLMGAEIEYLGDDGFPPLRINGRRLHGGKITMRGDLSSQFASALLMIAPLVGGVCLTLEGKIVSGPYIDMTLAVMRHYGIAARRQGNIITVPAGRYVPAALTVEGDWSAASYWFALQALLPKSHIMLSPLSQRSWQGDRAIADIMAPLGVTATWHGNVLELGCATVTLPQYYMLDMTANPDLVPTLAVTLCLMRVPFTLTGVGNLRIKESDRLAALKGELAKLGFRVGVGRDTLSYDGSRSDPHGEVIIDPHDDHRLAMAFSLAATRHRGITIRNAEVVSKSYPGWWIGATRNY